MDWGFRNSGAVVGVEQWSVLESQMLLQACCRASCDTLQYFLHERKNIRQSTGIEPEGCRPEDECHYYDV